MISPCTCTRLVTGLDYMRDPKLCKGLSFTLEERQTLGIHGLLPPRYLLCSCSSPPAPAPAPPPAPALTPALRVKSQQEQADHSMKNLRRYEDPLNQYMYMIELLER